MKSYPEGGKTALHFLLPSIAQKAWNIDRKPFFPLVQRFLDAGVDREQQDEEGNTAIFGYVAVQPEYETEFEFTRDTVYVDLEEQRGVMSQFDIHATN